MTQVDDNGGGDHAFSQRKVSRQNSEHRREAEDHKSLRKGSTRRQFLTRSSLALTGAALAGPWPMSRKVYGSSGSANSSLGVAIIGYGSRGASLLRNLMAHQTSGNLNFPMVCDVWKHRFPLNTSRGSI